MRLWFGSSYLTNGLVMKISPTASYVAVQGPGGMGNATIIERI
jgi:hypothetical protein